MISILRRGATRHFFTGTSAPCLSVFKPVPLGSGKVETGGADDDNLFSRHERLHRIVLEDYELRRRAIEGDRSAFETKALAALEPTAATARDLFSEHRERIHGWTISAERIRARLLRRWA